MVVGRPEVVPLCFASGVDGDRLALVTTRIPLVARRPDGRPAVRQLGLEHGVSQRKAQPDCRDGVAGLVNRKVSG